MAALFGVVVLSPMSSSAFFCGFFPNEILLSTSALRRSNSSLSNTFLLLGMCDGGGVDRGAMSGRGRLF
jgi:hypothetical protein